MNKYLQIAILILLAVVIALLIPKNRTPNPVVNNFEECRSAGGTVTSNFPATCVMPDGRTFAQEQPQIMPDVVVDSPQPNDLVTSPLIVKGRARGTWYFEANLPVTLKDTNGNILAQKGFMTSDNWMTTDYAEFQDTLTFSNPQTQYGLLLIEKDNPSGEPQNDEAFPVPVRFW
jgi:hypothetical protein